MIPRRIIVHHSLTKDSGTVSWGAIRYYHTVTLGWKEIGYHSGVELVQSGQHFYNEILLGRPWDMAGAHTIGQNHDSLGICFVGNYDLIRPPEPMLVVGGQLIGMWLRLFNIPKSEIYGHRDFADYKTCPGTKFDLNELKRWVL
jgi:hypothetical protein